MIDTITAIATPFGNGGIGIIRISGPASFEIASKVFSIKKSSFAPLKEFESHRVRHGYIFNEEKSAVVDEVLLIPMKGPSSYTAEDVIEIQAHAGSFVLRAILEEIITAGARLSEPGEFTKRAFLNQRIDLTQAEAVIDIIQAKSQNALKIATSQITGAFGTEIRELRQRLINFLSLIEAGIDFPDDVDAFVPSEKEIQDIGQILEKCRSFIRQHNDACFLKEGIKITICGVPNVGKSSLMNRLLEKDRSIITPIPGTTRDPVEDMLNIDGASFIITDTAGIHETDDLVEIIGIEKAKDHISESDLVLFMKEPGMVFYNREFEKLVPGNKKVIFVINKTDLSDRPLPELTDKYQQIPTVKISALLNEGIQELKQTILHVCIADLDIEKSPIIPNLRHKKALEQAVIGLEAILSELEVNKQPEEETIAFELKQSIDALGTITGETASLDILDHIFSNFCIGK
jgi:tRNA modification GTPase